MKRIIAITISLFLLASITACNLPFGQNPPPTDEPGNDQPPPPVASNTPEFTFTPSNTPLPTYTFTLAVPMVSVSTETNCRTGPGTVYDKITVLLVGQQAEVVGRASDGGTWIIRSPSNPSQFCWLWGYYATVTGNWQALPIFDTPPTPTPIPGFTVTYLSTATCGGMFGLRFLFVNNGSITWNSYRVIITDSTTVTTVTYTEDSFTDYTGCGPFAAQLLDLAPGESGVAGNWAVGLFGYNPAGHNLSATFTLCSLDGLAGQCLDKTISVIP